MPVSPEIAEDKELREVVTMQLRNVVNAERPNRPIQIETRQLLATAIPLTVVAACIIVLLSTCYPKAVFLWGDEVDRYERILQRRKFLWTVVVGVTIIGLLSRLLFESVANWLPSP